MAKDEGLGHYLLALLDKQLLLIVVLKCTVNVLYIKIECD